jgi:hypothetical protein
MVMLAERTRKSVARFGLRIRFRYEKNLGFPSENQEQIGLTHHYLGLLFQYARLSADKACVERKKGRAISKKAA